MLEESNTVTGEAIKAAMTALVGSAMMALLPSIVDAANSPGHIPDLSAGGAAWRETHTTILSFLLQAPAP